MDVKVEQLPLMRAVLDAADKAIRAARDNCDQEWYDAARAATLFVADRDATFTATDVWDFLGGIQVPPPREPRALGAVFRELERAGEIARAGGYRQTPRAHGRPMAIWRKRGRSWQS